MAAKRSAQKEESWERVEIPDIVDGPDWTAPSFVWPDSDSETTADVRKEPAPGAAPRPARPTVASIADPETDGPDVPDTVVDALPSIEAIPGPVPAAGLDASLRYAAGDPALRLLRDYGIPADDDDILYGAIITVCGISDGNREVLRYDLSGTGLSATHAALPMLGFNVLKFHGADSAANYRKVLNTVRYLNLNPMASGGNRAITFEVMGADQRLVDLRTIVVSVDGWMPDPTPRRRERPSQADRGKPGPWPTEPSGPALFAASAGYHVFAPGGGILTGPANTRTAEYLFRKNALWVRGRGAYVLFADHVPQGGSIGPMAGPAHVDEPGEVDHTLVVLPAGAELTVGATKPEAN